MSFKNFIKLLHYHFLLLIHCIIHYIKIKLIRQIVRLTNKGNMQHKLYLLIWSFILLNLYHNKI
jgi:hypothetical protein